MLKHGVVKDIENNVDVICKLGIVELSEVCNMAGNSKTETKALGEAGDRLNAYNQLFRLSDAGQRIDDRLRRIGTYRLVGDEINRAYRLWSKGLSTDEISEIIHSDRPK